MSGLGMLATALAGGAQVVGKQAGDDIEAGRRSEMMREQAAIQQQMEERLIEARARSAREQNINLRADNRAFDSDDETIAANAKVTTAAGKTARDVERERLADTGLNEAARKKATDDAAAVEASKRQLTTEAGSDQKYLKALRTISNASAAPDRTDYKGRELDNAIKQMTVDNANRAQVLRGEFGKAAPERQQQIKDELSMLTGKDTDKFVPVPIKDENGAITGYQVFDTKSGRFVDGGAKSDDPILANLKAQRAAAEAAKSKPAAEPAASPSGPPAGAGMLKSFTAGTGRSQVGAITEDPPRRSYQGGFIFNGKTYPTMEAAKTARGY